MNETGFVNRCYLIEGSPETVDLEVRLGILKLLMPGLGLLLVRQ